MQVHAVASRFLGCSTVARGMSLSCGMARLVRRRGRAGVVEIMTTTMVLYVESCLEQYFVTRINQFILDIIKLDLFMFDQIYKKHTQIFMTPSDHIWKYI